MAQQTQSYKRRNFNRWHEREGEILEFLNQPRTHKELREFLQFVSLPYSKNKYIYPLVEAGKVQLLHPESKSTKRQKYISTASDIDMLEWEKMKGAKIRKSPERILQMCNKPQTFEEIAMCHRKSRLKDETVRKHLDTLVESGALVIFNDKYIRPDCMMTQQIYDQAKVFCGKPRTSQEIAWHFKLGKGTKAQRYMNDFLEKGIIRNVNLMSNGFRQNFYLTSYIDIEPLTEQGILDYCKTPRKSTEVTKHFGICGRVMMRNYIDELVEQGKLQPAVGFAERAERQKFISIESGFPVFTEQTLLEYCKTPRRSGQVARHFQITSAKLYPYLYRWLDEGKLKITSITNNTSHRKYMTVG